ncbi:hypothetical protein ACIQ7Q_33650 [Streptomyces sp. NPDC096176]|uniref:hypothetical protein n=1 Tax=Streptomyces sp. NPDC096176 TaxID=3366079 RepID=UPI0037F23565
MGAPEPQRVAPLALETPLPLRLLTEQEIAERAARLARAQEATRRMASMPPVPSGTFDIVQRLIQQGAPPEAIDRARRAIQEDQQFAREQTGRAGGHAAQLRKHVEQVSTERQRRQQLSPAEQQAEDAERARRSFTPPPHRHSPPPMVALPLAEAPRQSGRTR